MVHMNAVLIRGSTPGDWVKVYPIIFYSIVYSPLSFFHSIWISNNIFNFCTKLLIIILKYNYIIPPFFFLLLNLCHKPEMYVYACMCVCMSDFCVFSSCIPILHNIKNIMCCKWFILSCVCVCVYFVSVCVWWRERRERMTQNDEYTSL